MLLLFSALTNSLSDDDFVITKDLVKAINNNPNSTFKAVYYPKFGSMRLRDFKRFLSPVRKAPKSHGSPRPVGYDEKSFHNSDKRMFTGIHKEITKSDTKYDITYKVQYPSVSDTLKVPFPVFDNKKLCSTWASAVTSAMSTTLSRWSNSLVNLSLQFLLDCDIIGDSCVERPPLSAYEQFWRRYIPRNDGWDEPEDPLRAPHPQLTQEMCDKYNSCYPGLGQEHGCKREIVLTGSCELGNQQYGTCPIYFLYNWRWIKSHLAEVGAVTSSIIVRPAFFAYDSGVYSSNYDCSDPGCKDVLGMLDVTIIGWGQTKVNLAQDSTLYSKSGQRWWYVIPHLGYDYGLTCSQLVESWAPQSNDVPDAYVTSDSINTINSVTIKQIHVENQENPQNPDILGDTKNDIQFIFGPDRTCSTKTPTNQKTGIILFNRRFDDSNIESHAVGAVPYNFLPKAWKTA